MHYFLSLHLNIMLQQVLTNNIMPIRIAKLKKNQIQFHFSDLDESPFDYSFEIREGEYSEIYLHQEDEESRMMLTLQESEHWDIFLRNDLFLSLLSLTSSVVINHGLESTKRQVEEILRGSDIKIRWQKKFDCISSALSKVIVFKQDLISFKDLFEKEKLDIMSMAEIKRDNAFKYVKRLGVKLVTQSNFRTDIAGTIQRLKDVYKQTSGEERFKVKGNKHKFDEIEKEVREAYVSSFANSVDSEVDKQSKQNIINMLEERFSEIDTKMEKRQLNLTKFGLQIDHFINLIIEGEDNKEKVQILIGFLLQKVLKFFRLKPQQICWSGLPTVRQVISERSSRSRDYQDYFQQKEELMKTISDLKSQVEKYEKQLQSQKIINSKIVMSKPTTPMNSAKPLFTSSKFSKTANKPVQKQVEKKQVRQKQLKQSKDPRQKNFKTQMSKLKTGASSRSSLSSTASLNLNKSIANIPSFAEKNKKSAIAGLETPLPLLEMKLNKTVNAPSSGIKTPKTTSKPKFDSAKKPLEPLKPSLRSTKVSSRLLK